MTSKTLIAVTGDKGGVGKSTITALLAEWLNFQGVSVKVIDSDPNQTTQTWVDKCADEGRIVSTADADVTIVDTAGTKGASLSKYIMKADIILVPFKPHIADLEVIVAWFYSLKESLQDRVLFVPNMLTRTKEQNEGYSVLQDAITEEGRGEIISGLSERNAIYPAFLDGAKNNFFAGKLNEKTRAETEALFTRVTESMMQPA